MVASTKITGGLSHRVSPDLAWNLAKCASKEQETIMRIQLKSVFVLILFIALSGWSRSASAMLTPQLGRFMQQDPLGYVRGVNTFLYEGALPISRGDASGLKDYPAVFGTFSADPMVISRTIHLMRITFRPNAELCPKCNSLRMVQAYQGGAGELPAVDTSNYLTKPDATKKIQGGWAIDTDPTNVKCEPGKGCTIYYADTTGPGTVNKDGSNIDGQKPGDVVLGDSPTFNNFMAETCVQCADKGNGDFLVCLNWGYKTAKGASVATEIPPTVSSPSPTFMAALSAYNTYWGNKK
jgi:hypothetical protein